MTRPAHPSRAIETALRHAEAQGFRVRKAGRSSHAWGRLYAPDGVSLMSIWSTPRSTDQHAGQIRRFIARTGGEG